MTKGENILIFSHFYCERYKFCVLISAFFFFCFPLPKSPKTVNFLLDRSDFYLNYCYLEKCNNVGDLHIPQKSSFPFKKILSCTFSLLSVCCKFNDNIHSLKSFIVFCGKLNSWPDINIAFIVLLSRRGRDFWKWICFTFEKKLNKIVEVVEKQLLGCLIYTLPLHLSKEQHPPGYLQKWNPSLRSKSQLTWKKWTFSCAVMPQGCIWPCELKNCPFLLPL